MTRCNGCEPLPRKPFLQVAVYGFQRNLLEEEMQMRKRQLSDEEKEIVLRKHGMRCFVTGHPIESEKDLDFHHLKAYGIGGETTIDNIAPVCRKHHRTIGTMSLLEYRDKLKMEEFFDTPDPRKLDHILTQKLGEFGLDISYEVEDSGSSIVLHFIEGRGVYPLYECPVTGTKYFYAVIPAKYLKNDLELQPRPLRKKALWNLYRHLRKHTQISPSICRIDNSHMLLFDGQHKAAAQIWAGRTEVECKVYLEPDAIALKETNLIAHEKLRQMSFYSITLYKKYADIFKHDWNEYMELESGEKSESGFVRFLQSSKNQSKAQANKKILSALMNDVLDNPDNKLVEYIAEKNRTRKNPLTTHRLKITFFREFMVPPPTDVEFESEDDHREDEKKNLVQLMNIVAEETLVGKWNPQARDAEHKKAKRIYLSGSVRGWVPLLKDVIAQVLLVYDTDERKRIFFREISDDDFEIVKKRVERLFSHTVWVDPDPDIDKQLKVNDASHTKDFMKEKDLNAAWVLGMEY